MSITLANSYTVIVYQVDQLDAKTLQSLQSILGHVRIDFYGNEFKLYQIYHKNENSCPTLEEIREIACKIIDTGLFQEVDIEECTKGSSEYLRKVYLEGTMINEMRCDRSSYSKYPSDGGFEDCRRRR